LIKFRAQSEDQNIVNGVNVTALLQTVDDPATAKFRFNVNNKWLDGAHKRSMINGFHGAMQDIERPQSFVLHADEHPILLGCDQVRMPGNICFRPLPRA